MNINTNLLYSTIGCLYGISNAMYNIAWKPHILKYASKLKKNFSGADPDFNKGRGA